MLWGLRAGFSRGRLAAGKRGAGGRSGGGGIRGGGLLPRALGVRMVAGFAAGECCARALHGGGVLDAGVHRGDRRACGRRGFRGGGCGSVSRGRRACGRPGVPEKRRQACIAVGVWEKRRQASGRSGGRAGDAAGNGAAVAGRGQSTIEP
jgi:hypothetical protein